VPKIDFHILEETSGLKSLHYACQLIEKTYQQQKRSIYIHVNSPEEADHFDTLLWTFRDDSFLPHDLHDPTHHASAPIEIGFNEAPSRHDNIMINLHNNIPRFYAQFNQVIEIVFSDASMQQLARARFKQYRDAGCEINTYKIKANAL
jgi:DNA polymerase-3 subunit chi